MYCGYGHSDGMFVSAVTAWFCEYEVCVRAFGCVYVCLIGWLDNPRRGLPKG